MSYVARAPPATPPDKGSFPLDHEARCKESMKLFTQCLEESNNLQAPCRSLSLAYLKCRMDNGLMAASTDEELGFKAGTAMSKGTVPVVEDKRQAVVERQKEGYIAGALSAAERMKKANNGN